MMSNKKSKQLDNTLESEVIQSFVRIDVSDSEILKTSQVDDNNDGGKVVNRSASARHNAGHFLYGAMKKKRRVKCEELYTDKDRAAAVNMGSKDIKQSLKLKRLQDRSKALLIPEEADPAQFLALANYEMTKKELTIALSFLNKALELNPIDKIALVARSKCYILMGQPENGLKDAESALNIDKTYLKGIYQKAESLYYLGDFEHSLMYFHRGLHIRPEHEDFKLGVEKSQKAIETALGIKSSDPIKHKKHKKQAKTHRLLKELAIDKEYLNNLLKDPNIRCKHKENDDKIVKYVEETIEYLNKRQEFWRQQLPPNI